MFAVNLAKTSLGCTVMHDNFQKKNSKITFFFVYRLLETNFQPDFRIQYVHCVPLILGKKSNVLFSENTMFLICIVETSLSCKSNFEISSISTINMCAQRRLGSAYASM